MNYQWPVNLATADGPPAASQHRAAARRGWSAAAPGRRRRHSRSGPGGNLRSRGIPGELWEEKTENNKKNGMSSDVITKNENFKKISPRKWWCTWSDGSLIGKRKGFHQSKWWIWFNLSDEIDDWLRPSSKGVRAFNWIHIIKFTIGLHAPSIIASTMPWHN